jgi:hypothetical protein
VSGNVSLGNSGAFQLLLACARRGVELKHQTSINLRACDIKSPLSNQFIQVVQQLHGVGGAGSHKVDLVGNLIDNEDLELLT